MSRPYKNKAALPEEYLVLLEQDLGQLAAVDPELPASLLRYVIDGEEPESVERLATAPRKEKPFVWPGVMVPVQAAPEKRRGSSSSPGRRLMTLTSTSATCESCRRSGDIIASKARLALAGRCCRKSLG